MSEFLLIQTSTFEKYKVSRPVSRVKGQKNYYLHWAKEQGLTIVDQLATGKSISPIVPREEFELWVARQKPTNGKVHEPENAAPVLARLQRIEELQELSMNLQQQILDHLTQPK